ncbi:MAG: ATP-binding cassette domain-containing protein, partial [Deltaproteobacteria bacterium]|nr:ATP-binding cassette domain-containing protein [Deltaproteobacteria bacterium]
RSGGDAWLGGFHIEKESLKAKKHFGMVMQSINLDQELTIFENLDIHGRLFNMSSAKRRKKIDELLAYVDLVDRKKSLVKQLSGGMKRRLMIARAMVHSPRILFLDEPTVGLDAEIRRRIWGLIKKIQNRGTTILLTTHYIEEAEFLADRVAFLDEGKIVVIDTPQKLMDQTGSWAIDRIDGDKMKTVYFKTRPEADAFIARQQESYTLRRVNLEDSFLSFTGKKVLC